MGATAGEYAVAPLFGELGIDLEQLPPGAEGTTGVGFDNGAARDHVDQVVVGAVAVEQDDFFEAMIGQAFGDIKDVTG